MGAPSHGDSLAAPCGQAERLATFPEQNPNPVVELDHAGEPTYLNPVGLAHFPDLPATGRRRPLVAALRNEIRAIRHGRQSALTCERRIGDRFYQIKMADLPESRLVRVFLNDVTDRVEAEEALAGARDKALESSRLKSEFLANVSHEVRTPLTGILGMIEILEDTRLNQEQAGYLGTLRESAEALITILNDILDLSKIEAGRLELFETDYELVPLIRGAASLLAPKARERGLTLDTYVDPSLPGILRGDPVRLRQILLNLISNAIKFTERGSVHVRADRIADGSAAEPGLRLSVRDTGVGLSSEAQRQLFQAFVQVDGSPSRRHGGTGLGLAISKQLAEMMGGRIGVDSAQEAGSTFRVDLPLVPGEFGGDSATGGTARSPSGSISARQNLPEENLPEEKLLEETLLEEKLPEQTTDGQRSGGATRILVAEDHPVNQLVVRHQLERLGFSVLIVSDGEAALAALEAERFDLVLMDCQMPAMDGYEATRAIRERERGSGGHLPIVAMTAGARPEDREACLAAGMDDFLSKPVSVRRIAEVVGDLLGPSGSRRRSPPRPVRHPPFTRLKQLLEPDRRAIREVLTAFRGSLEEVVPATREAVSDRDPGRLRSLAHRLKGTCANVGADGMAAIAKRLEAAASRRAWKRAGLLVSEADSERLALLSALERELAGDTRKLTP